MKCSTGAGMSCGKNYSQISHGEEDEIYPLGLGNRTSTNVWKSSEPNFHRVRWNFPTCFKPPAIGISCYIKTVSKNNQAEIEYWREKSALDLNILM